MKEALDFLKENNEVAFATIGNGRPQMRVFQIMKQSGTTLWFATGPHKRVYAELQENPAVEILSRNGNISVRVSGDAEFDIPDDICKEIYDTNKEIYDTNSVLSRLYPNYKSLAYFRVEIDRLDYYDLSPTPPVLRHYDRASGQYMDLNPFGVKNV